MRSTEKDWIKERQAAHLAAFQTVRQMTNADKVAAFKSLANECGERAGDVTDHDTALPDLIQEALCLLAAEVIKKGGLK